MINLAIFLLIQPIRTYDIRCNVAIALLYVLRTFTDVMVILIAKQ